MKENNWKAGCDESCTSGLVGGSKKSADDSHSNYGSTVAPLDSTQHLEGKLDLNEYLIKNPPATFFVRVSGDSMIGAGIYPEDILVVDRSEEPKSGKIVIAVIDGELTVKRLKQGRDGVCLLPENLSYAPIAITPEMAFQVWGVVTYVIHKP